MFSWIKGWIDAKNKEKADRIQVRQRIRRVQADVMYLCSRELRKAAMKEAEQVVRDVLVYQADRFFKIGEELEAQND